MQPVAERGEQVLQAEAQMGPYRLVKRLRQGGMASVYLGSRPNRKAYVAIKVTELLNGYVDVRSEVYSVGILLYQILTGSLPFDGPDQWKICQHHRETQPLAPSFLNPSLPRPAERVVLRALEKEPRRCYRTIGDLLRAFQGALDTPTCFGLLSPRWRATRRNPRNRL